MTTTGLISRNRVHPQRLALFIACGSILMMFGALTSAYIVRQSAGNWLEFSLPSLFFVSTGVLVLSSITLQWCYSAFAKHQTSLYRGLLLTTFVLGFAFVILQFQAWEAMFAAGLPLKGNPSPSFVYVLSGLHAAHVLGGIVALIIALIHGFRLPVVATPRRKLRLQLTLTYWHFMDFLWIYLLVFFVLQR
jgi:cytochrome c oxidase subunit 3